jgi:DNA-binding MarR family transcriptional regulator
MSLNTEADTIQGMIAAIELFRAMDTDMPSPAIAAFLHVASMPGLSIQEVADALKVSQSTASRNVFYLSKAKTPTLPGLDLVESRINEMDRRQKQLFLTQKGEHLAATLKRVLT